MLNLPEGVAVPCLQARDSEATESLPKLCGRREGFVFLSFFLFVFFFCKTLEKLGESDLCESL